MKHRKLPFELELEALQAQQGDEAFLKTRSVAFLETARTAGFQLVTGILRNQELVLLEALRLGVVDPAKVTFLAGGLATIRGIRDALASLLPADQQASVDFFDDEEEPWLGPSGVDGSGRMES